MNISLSPFAPENLVSRDGFGSPVPRQPAHLHTRAESGAYLRDSSRVPRRRPFIYLKPPYAIESVPSLSGHAIAYRIGWCSLPRVRRHRASKPQGSSERVLPWQVTTDQLICAYLSHTHVISYRWYRSTGMVATNPDPCQLFRENIFFPCPRSHLRIWYREAGSAVPSHVSPFILHIQQNKLKSLIRFKVYGHLGFADMHFLHLR